ncbi:hypothetical protein RRX38_02715 [Pseudomonas sp. DTU_2021_1001937_2_SI_NGA_ILE_001]|uniref:hypothetical protein n=1 Tax=Pseudomonas sp. DTU_2021_1001937_2_SI_NGA_ILE_001 TaxID=3077589 RepID=UPI0028FC2F8D|nr:hypothetical protein [Pseudomonas sp. DTU_2021_1001937_2_SI_NGA_ILE_001]WNW10103.1 hypothetical protein RRX38_02715 [Pseudomonas sp. DTU_2021_1001937_2_SI_NGA_ILE_001]
MIHDIVVDGFAMDVEVLHCVNIPAAPGSWSSDWDAQGEREIDFRVVSAIEYDDAGGKRVAPDTGQLQAQYAAQIETALWFEIDSRAKRLRCAV